MGAGLRWADAPSFEGEKQRPSPSLTLTWGKWGMQILASHGAILSNLALISIGFRRIFPVFLRRPSFAKKSKGSRKMCQDSVTSRTKSRVALFFPKLNCAFCYSFVGKTFHTMATTVNAWCCRLIASRHSGHPLEFLCSFFHCRLGSAGAR